MSYCITFVKDDRCISASFYPQLNLTTKYELAIVEVFIPATPKFDKGIIRIYNTATKSVVALLNLNNITSMDGLMKYAKSLSISAEFKQCCS